MATYNAIENTKGTESGSELDDRGKLVLTASRSWSVVLSEPGDSPTKVKQSLQQAGELPNEGDAHPDNSFLICRNVNIVEDDHIYYLAKAIYRSIPFEAGEAGEPWDTSATVSYRSVTSTADVDEDYNGEIIANPGTDEPVFGVQRRVSDVLAIIKRPFLVFSGPTIRGFMDKVNTDTFLGFPPGEGMVQTISADESTYEQIKYYNVTAEILFRTPYRTTSSKSWYHRRILKGYYEKIPNQTEPKRIVDLEKNPVSTPHLIDDTGLRLDPGSTPYTEERKLYGEVAFSGMGFFT